MSDPAGAASVAQRPWWIDLPHEDHEDDTAVCVRCMAEREADYRDTVADLRRQVAFLSSELHDARHALDDAQSSDSGDAHV